MNIPRGGLIGRAWSVGRRVQTMRIPFHAAHAGYFIVLALFPALVLVLNALRYTDLDAADLMAVLQGFVPSALLPAAEKLIISTYAHTSRAMVSISAIGALWSASRGVYGVMLGLNAIYGTQENRGYLRTRLICMVYTFGLLLVLVLTLGLNLFGEALENLLPWVVDLRFFLLLLLQTGLFMAIYAVLPNRKNPISDCLPGAVLASLGWLIFTELFSLYVEYFRSYATIYGSVYAVALSMLWLYCCLSILFYGGALNVLLAEWSEA